MISITEGSPVIYSLKAYHGGYTASIQSGSLVKTFGFNYYFVSAFYMGTTTQLVAPSKEGSIVAHPVIDSVLRPTWCGGWGGAVLGQKPKIS